MTRRRQVQPDGVGELTRAVRAFRLAEQKLATATLEASEAGSSLRTIAVQTGFSHEKVRGILASERSRVAGVKKRLDRPPIATLSVSGGAKEQAARRRLARTLPVETSGK